ncbi:osmoprotectant transport system ATP-binding protein [Ancylobacter aquaticus]|uniref:Osmoprotectant transport system ATP-binding protein n=1 Tax=Ancylobacter aquaticus TaxID=100 RepID=A0A4R1HSJ8_ANCAQ|nr:ATP-binding cassette domain-containing protein [Ancylobacter aquaticus]TCK23550.1 osmoprotectant transport system ATP-binding protein [Ancylobacter aquaticus]
MALQVEFRDVTKAFPGTPPAVDRLSLTVEAGTILALVGPSGCGKTTTMKMVNRLIEPTSGDIVLGDTPISQMPVKELRRMIGYVIQYVGLFPHMSVAENIAIVPRLLGWGKARIDARVDELLTLVGLVPETHRARYPRSLSGGQQQRVGVARALAADPPVLLMDEPFGALDPITRVRVQDELLAIQRKVRKTIIIVTHDMDEAIRLGDKVAVLRAGRLVQHQPPVDILRHPKDDFVAELIGHDRLVKLLSTLSVASVMGDAAAPAAAPAIDRTATLEAAFLQMLDTGRDELAVEGGGSLHIRDLLRASTG